MGGNIETGMMDILPDEETRRAFEEHFHKVLDKKIPGDMKAEERERRHDEGPPIFRVGEVLEFRGGRFEVKLISEEALVLMPVKG